MKKRRLNIDLFCEDGRQFFTIDKNHYDYRNPEDLVELIRKGVRSKLVKNAVKKIDENKQTYIFTFKEYNEKTEEEEKTIISIKVSNKDKNLIPVVPIIEDFCQTTVLMKKINIAKVLALSVTGTVLLSIATPFIAEDFAEKIKEEQEYDYKRYHVVAPIPEPTSSEIQEGEEKHYNELKEKIKNGEKLTSREEQDLAEYETEKYFDELEKSKNGNSLTIREEDLSEDEIENSSRTR